MDFLKYFLLTSILLWGGGGEKIVIDVGANLGDSSLFFAKKGFKVIGFEPLNEVYEIALENIKLNNLEGKITLVNKGVGAKKGFIQLYYNDINSSLSATTTKPIKINTKKRVEVTTIDEIIKEYALENLFLLKMDCEGCEFEIISNSNLSMFKEIVFEYHTFLSGIKYNQLTDKLEKEGFNIFYHKIHNNELGVIHMKNINSK